MGKRKRVVTFEATLAVAKERLEVFATAEGDCLLAKLSIPDGIAPCFEVFDLKIRGISQVVLVPPTTSIPGVVFGESVEYNHLKLDVARAGDIVTLVVRNVTNEPLEFRAWLEM